jgi:hypothetical protein
MTEGLSSQISQIYDCLQRVESIAKEVEDRSKKYDAIFAQCTSLNVKFSPSPLSLSLSSSF